MRRRKSRVTRQVTQAILASGLYLSSLHAQTLTVTPNRVLSDQTAVVRATALQPNEHATLKADLVDGDGQRWESEAEFVADAQGSMDLSTQAPVRGSYRD